MAEQTDTSTDVEVNRQASFPGLELPEYHGRQPSGMKSSITGASNRIQRPHLEGERIVAVVELSLKGAGHDFTEENGLVYYEKLKVRDLFEVAGPAGKRLLSAVRQSYRLAEDQRNGKAALEHGEEDLSTAGVTDASGVVLTPSELAEIQGDPVRAMLDEAKTPVVVLYSDGARELWPDDFDTEQSRPVAGERFEVEGNGVGYVYVAKLLDAETGETLVEWTEDEENARLEATEGHLEHAEEEAERRRAEEIDAKLADSAEAIDEARQSDDLEPLAEAPLPGEEGYDEGLEPLEKADDEDLAEVIPGGFPPEPEDDDFALVDNDVEVVRNLLTGVDDLDRARRLLEAEKRGRGRGLKARKGALDAIHRKIELLDGDS